MKKKASVLLLILLLLLIITIILVNVVSADLGTINAEDQEFSCNLTAINPNGNITYSKTMPLNLTIDWNQNDAIFWIGDYISYSIDDKPASPIENNYFNFEYGNQIVHIEVGSNIDISELEAGQHKLNIIINGTYNVDNDFVKPFSASFKPISFEVLGTVSPTPTVPEFPSTPLLILMVIVFTGSLVYFKKYKQVKLDV